MSAAAAGTSATALGRGRTIGGVADRRDGQKAGDRFTQIRRRRRDGRRCSSGAAAASTAAAARRGSSDSLVVPPPLPPGVADRRDGR